MASRVDEFGGVQWFKHARRRAYTYRYESDVAVKVALAIGFAALTGLAAQVRIPLSVTPVPITLQTFAVLLTGVALGKKYGALSQGIYGGAGVAGVPWFTNMSGGLGALFGPTGGYIVGFVVAAAFVGWVVDRWTRARTLPVLLGVLFVANFVVIYAFGLAGLAIFLTVSKGAVPSAMTVLKLGLFPFVAGDVVKLVFAGLVGAAITPDSEFGPETL